MTPWCTVTIDTEEEWDWSTGCPTHAYGTANIQSLPRFQELCDRFGIATTYFTAYAVVENAVSRKVIQTLAKHENVEIGLHIHPWNTPPIAFTDPVPTRETYLHNLPESLAFAKLQTVYDALVEAGLHPVSFRGGRYSTGPGIQRWLMERGFLVDASVVPFTAWDDDGSPDYRQRTLEVVRHESSVPTNPPLWEIPLTRGFTRTPFAFWQRCYDRVTRSWLRRLRLIGIAERLGIVRKIWLNFEQHPAEELTAFLDTLLGSSLPCVCLTLHSSSLRAGCSPYVRTPSDEARLYGSLETVFRHLVERGYRPATTSNVARDLESTHAYPRHQPSR